MVFAKEKAAISVVSDRMVIPNVMARAQMQVQSTDLHQQKREN